MPGGPRNVFGPFSRTSSQGLFLRVFRADCDGFRRGIKGGFGGILGSFLKFDENLLNPRLLKQLPQLVVISLAALLVAHRKF